MSASWIDAANFVEAQLAAHVGNLKHLKAWLHTLKDSIDGERLGVCIAIDLATGSIHPATVAGIIDIAGTKSGKGRSVFASALSSLPNYKDLLISSALPKTNLNDNESYVRIISLSGFITYCIQPSYSSAFSLNPLDKHEIRTWLRASGRLSLGDISVWWTGTTPVVWVGLHSEIERMIVYPEAADLISDRLGLGFSKGEEVVVIEYPAEFDRSISCRQPTVLDVNWAKPGGFYLSYKNDDGWGRTHSCSGIKDNKRERVHGHFKNLTGYYFARYVGSISKIVMDRNELIRAAYARLEQVLP